ncbi:5-(carboxyamino)imidazole ribonucleotide synthase [bacterium A37T11]|nr:5-(carboxyamino)imidazole ribonucleotide synthase [bacterium A37T11]
MIKDFYGDLRLGILGGGQLGRMLIQEAISLNVNVYVLDPDPDAPCKNLCERFVCGRLDDYETVYQFGKQLDMLTIEIEKVNVDALEKLEEEGVLVYPQARVIRLIQDKGLQKQFFKQNDIPTAPFQLLNSKESLRDEQLIPPFIQKLRKDGYDGKGVRKIVTEADFKDAFDAPSVIEEWIDFKKEIAVIVSRNDSGDIKAFPCVEMEFNPDANLVEFLISPAALDPGIQARAEELAIKIAEDLQIVGLLAVEMFLTKDGAILVNELAPRPHNSGHQSIEGNYTSQFAQHLRAIFNLPLGNTEVRLPAVMINLLGSDNHEGLARYEGLEESMAIEGVYVHLYGKKFTKPFRKMGHVCIIHEDREAAINNARKVQGLIKVIV